MSQAPTPEPDGAPLTLEALLAPFEPPPSDAAWRAAVTRDLKGADFERRLVTHTPEGVAVQPLYTPRPGGAQGSAAAPEDGVGLPGDAPYTRGYDAIDGPVAPWQSCQTVQHPDPAVARRQLLADLGRGVDGFALRFDRAARAGLDTDNPAAASLAHRDGLPLACADDLARLLDGVPLDRVAIHLDAGGSGLLAGACLIRAAETLGFPLGALSGSFGVDPLGTLARRGRLPASLPSAWREAAAAAAWCDAEAPGLRALTVSVEPYQGAGASAVDQLASLLATGVAYLRALDYEGVAPAVAARQMAFRVGVGRDFFMEVAKLRAARALWTRVLEACGVTPSEARPWLMATTADVTKTSRDPWVNILRATSEAFAAAISGADAVTVAPWDARLGAPSDAAVRLAANTHTMLREESHLRRVADPAGGSWYVEHLTAALARAAWERFQRLESAGGMTRALVEGRVARELTEARRRRWERIATRKDPVTGVSTFPNLGESRPTPAPVDLDALSGAARERLDAHRAGRDQVAAIEALAATVRSGGAGPKALADAVMASVTKGATLSALTKVLRTGETITSAPALELASHAAPWEALRDAADMHAARVGGLPKVFTVPLGSLKAHKARLDFAREALAAAGLVVEAGEPLPSDAPLGSEECAAVAEAFLASGAASAAIAGLDQAFDKAVPALARALRGAGARALVLVGRPGAEEPRFRSSGVTHVLRLGADVLAIGRDLLEHAGASIGGELGEHPDRGDDGLSTSPPPSTSRGSR